MQEEQKYEPRWVVLTHLHNAREVQEAERLGVEIRKYFQLEHVDLASVSRAVGDLQQRLQDGEQNTGEFLKAPFRPHRGESPFTVLLENVCFRVLELDFDGQDIKGLIQPMGPYAQDLVEALETADEDSFSARFTTSNWGSGRIEYAKLFNWDFRGYSQ